MTDTKNIPIELSFETLFANGTCLTYKPLQSLESYKYAKDLEEKYRKQNNTFYTQIKTTAILTTDSFNNKFHYFSNGILIYNFFKNENKNNVCLKRILKMLEIRKLPVNKTYDLSKIFDYFTASTYMNDLEKYAQKFYSYKDNVKITARPSIQDFVNDCFANNNILLTACKDEDVTADIRNDIALFADGRYYISNVIDKGHYADRHIKCNILKNEHKDFVFLCAEYVPQSYIDALYKEAEKYDWYISEEIQKQKNTPSSTEIEEMNKYIEKLFNNRKCLSVTNLTFGRATSFFSACPDTDKYALFSDGLLLISNKSKKDKIWIEYINKAYNDLTIKVKIVPDFYIPAIYSNLPKYQRSASDIYMEMLKERAKKIKKELKITHHEALEIVARAERWKDYKSINIKNEPHARYLIFDFQCSIKSTQFYIDIYNRLLKEKGGSNA
ncbi:MAG: hypothetical protein IJZ30_02985 [Alphaproteobacteria bacterium]|nr:hypothetical protein [Alphaproteobacteria bacterium]